MDKVVAILPTIIKGVGIGCEVYTNKKVFVDRRSCEVFLKHMACEKSISIKLMHKNIREILKVSRNLPYCIDAFNVFFPFKINQTENDDFRRGFVNCYYVRDIKNSTIILKNGMTLSSLNRDRAIKNNFNNASKIMYMKFARDMAKMRRSMDFIDEIALWFLIMECKNSHLKKGCCKIMNNHHYMLGILSKIFSLRLIGKIFVDIFLSIWNDLFIFATASYFFILPLPLCLQIGSSLDEVIGKMLGKMGRFLCLLLIF